MLLCSLSSLLIPLWYENESQSLKWALFILLGFFFPSSLKAVCDTINHLALFAFPLFFLPLVEPGRQPIPPVHLACEGLSCPNVLEHETAGTPRSGSRICLATPAWCTRGGLSVKESHWANEAPNISDRSILLQCSAEMESRVPSRTPSDLRDI